MAKLLIKFNGAPAREIQLKAGKNSFGCSAENDFQIEDESISGRHCEMVLNKDNQLLVRDLDSSNGTFLDRELVRECWFRRGQRIHLGSVEIVYADESAQNISSRNSELRISRDASGSYGSEAVPVSQPGIGLRVVPAEPRPIASAHKLRGTALAYNYRTFFQQIPGALSYPFKSNGLILLICGTILFVLLDFVGRFSLFLAVLGFGYLFLYMQRIVQYSAQGEEEMPEWPEISNWWDDILVPAFLLAATFAISFGPAFAMWAFLDVEPSIKWILGISLVLFGCFYLPMALLAVSMYDTWFALNPLLIVPSILRIPLEYMIACLMLGAVLAVRLLSLFVLNLIPIPIFPTVVAGFFSLYFLAVEMRILGVMYHSKREELNWNF